MKIPPAPVIDELTSAPGHITMGEHLSEIAKLISDLARDEGALGKPTEGSDYTSAFRNDVIALRENYQMSHSELLHALGIAVEEITGKLRMSDERAGRAGLPPR